MKKLLSIILALLLVAAVIPSGLFAATAAGLTDGLSDVATTAKNGSVYVDTVSNYFSYTDITGGGVKLKYLRFSADASFAYNTNIGSAVGAFPGTNGFSLQFDGYVNNNTDSTIEGNGIFTILLVNKPANAEIKTSRPFILINTNNGTLSLAHGTTSNNPGVYTIDQTVITSSLLKYESIKDKPFTVEFSPYSSTQVLVCVNINGKEAVSGLITKSLITSKSYGPSATSNTFYIGVGGTDTASGTAEKYNNWSINFYGYKALDADYTAPTPNATPNTNSDGLWDYATVSENAYTVSSSSYASFTDVTGGGVKLSYTKNSGNLIYAYNYNIGERLGAFPGDSGFSLYFDGYVNNNTANVTGNGIIAVTLTSTLSNEMGKIKTGVPFIMLDTVNGTLSLAHGTSSSVAQGYAVDQTIITDNALTYANINNKPFVISFSNYDNNNFLVTVNINGNAVAGIMPKALLWAQEYAPAKDASNFYVTVGGIDNVDTSNEWTVNFYGFKAKNVNIDLIGDDSQTVLSENLTATATISENAYATESGWISFSDITGGGVSLNYSRLSGALPYAFNHNIGLSVGAFPGAHGFLLQFDGYKNNNTDTNAVGNGIIAITLTSSLSDNYGKPRDGVPFLQIDTNEGTLKLRSGLSQSIQEFVDVQTIITSDLLKYENIAEVAFSVAMFPYDSTHILIAVNVDGASTVGLMDRSLFFNYSHAPSQTEESFYVSIGGIDNVQATNSWHINFYGYKNLNAIYDNTLVTASSASEVIAAINALPTSASIDYTQEILLAKAMYDSLSSTDKSAVTNYSTLSSLITNLNTLRQNQKVKPTAAYEAIEPTVENQFGNEGARTVYTSQTTNGFKAEWRGASYTTGTYSALTTQAVYGAHSLDGLRLYINPFSYSTASDTTDFWINFTSGDYSDCWDGTEAAANRMISVHLGLSGNNLEVNGAGTTATWIAGSSENLSKSKLRFKKIIVEWKKQTNGDYLCIISATNNVVAFTVSAEKIAAMTGFDENNVRIVIGTKNIKAKFSMVIEGVYSKVDSTVQSVTNQISALPSAITTDAEASTVDAVQAAYDALSVSQKEKVLNTQALTAARATARAYKGIDADGRDTDGFYIPNNDDILFHTSDSNSYAWTENSEYGGVHFNFNNGVYGVASTFKDKYVIDNLSIRFDNLHYGNDGAFILGFESTTSECQIFNYSSETTPYAIYLLIGRNNTVYSTLPYGDESKMFALFEANELLSAQNLINKEFFVSLGVNSDGAYTVTFTVDSTDFTYTYGENYMKNIVNFNSENFQIVLHTAAGLDPTTTPVAKNKYLQALSLDITGINYSVYSANQQQKIDEVEAAISTLSDTPSLSIEESVYTVWKQYFNLLSAHLRTGVANAAKLFSLRDGIFDLYMGDSKVNMYTEGYIGFSDIDNSSLVTPWVPDSEVSLDKDGWPTWTKDLVIAEAVPAKMSEGGTLLASDVEPYLQYLAKTGINGLWLTPVQDMGTDHTQVNYTNYGPHTVNPYLTGQIAYGEDWYQVDYDESRRILSEFVDLCHNYNIRIFFDFTTWGVASSAPIVAEHPDWFPATSSWGGPELDNENEEAYNFYYDSILEFITETGCDGIRWDLEPTEFGNTMVEQLHTELLAAGRKIIFISEANNDRGNGAYAFEQVGGVTGKGVSTQLFDSVFFNQTDIVEAIKNGNNINGEGQYKYYTYQMSCHDYIRYRQPSLASWAYEFAFSSFIPIFYSGEERMAYKNGGSCYGATINDYAEQITDPEKREYYENVKKLLQIRWQYKDLVNSTADNHSDTNICTVKVKGSEHVNGYARYAGNQGLIVVPNVNDRNPVAADFTVQLPIEAMGMSDYNYFTLTNLLTGEVIASGTAENVEYFTQNIAHNTAGVYMLTGENYRYTSNPGNIQIDRINITANGTQTTLEVCIDATVLTKLKNFNVSFTADGTATAITDYVNSGNYIVYRHSVSGTPTVDIKFSGGWGMLTYNSNTVTVDLARLNVQSGETFTQYVTLDMGDANADGVTDIKDLVRAKKMVAGIETKTDDADLNGDGSVLAADLTLLAKYIMTAKRGIKVNTLTFTDDDGKLLEKLLVPDGYGAKPTVTPSRYGHTFTGWSSATSDISESKTITAQYSAS